MPAVGMIYCKALVEIIKLQAFAEIFYVEMKVENF